MTQALRPSTLVPRGFVVEDAASDDLLTLITVRSLRSVSACPGCGTRSERIHSRYQRRLADLPMAGKPVRLVVVARRFHCDAVLCGRRIFAERFEEDVLAPWARRTGRLDHIVHHLGLALGGRPAASFARRLMVPVSNDTLLRVVRRRGSPRFVPPTVIGIDDWAWRRNQRYGTIICDLERRKTIALLPDREPATAQAWLSDQPQINVVARDRGGGYALAAAKALPKATQVADRWHLMENASRAFLDAVRKSMRHIRTAIGAATINPDLLTAAERIQMRDIFAGKTPTPPFSGWPRTGRRSRRSFDGRGTAAALSVVCCAVNARISFASGRARSNSTCHGLTPSGRLDSEMARSYGESSKAKGSAAAFGSSANGPSAVGRRKRSMAPC